MEAFASAPLERPRRRTFALAEQAGQFDHEVLDVARVTRVVKGGRRFRFRASVIIGDRAGRVAYGVGKSRDMQQAITKAQARAQKHLVTVPLSNQTIPHTVRAAFKASQVILRPAPPGTGIIAGGTVRAVVDLAGIRNVVAKCHGSTNRNNVAQAAIKALTQTLPSPKRKESYGIA